MEDGRDQEGENFEKQCNACSFFDGFQPWLDCHKILGDVESVTCRESLKLLELLLKDLTYSEENFSRRRRRGKSLRSIEKVLIKWFEFYSSFLRGVHTDTACTL